MKIIKDKMKKETIQIGNYLIDITLLTEEEKEAFKSEVFNYLKDNENKPVTVEALINAKIIKTNTPLIIENQDEKNN